jgi:hypothetical protein
VGVRLGWLPMTRRHLELSMSLIDALANFRDVFHISLWAADWLKVASATLHFRIPHSTHVSLLHLCLPSKGLYR